MDSRNKVGRPPGQQKSGGRKPGVQNKLTKEIKEKCEKIISLCMQDIVKEMDCLSMKDKILIVSSLTRFVLPQAVHMQNDNNHTLTIKWQETKTYEADDKAKPGT